MTWIVGVDEAGRGPLAGPVVSAAVILDPNKPIYGLNDSKKLSEKKREKIYQDIVKYAKEYAVGIAEVEEIDKLNILQASLLSMQRAVNALKMPIKKVLVDGCHTPKLNFKTEAIIKGDTLFDEIKAASIIAKVTRDKMMVELHCQYPEYGLLQHKGYPTKSHIAALEENGVSPIHRRSFGPVKRLLESPSVMPEFSVSSSKAS